MEAVRIALEQRPKRVSDDAIITVNGGDHSLRVLGYGEHNANPPAYRHRAGWCGVDLRSSACEASVVPVGHPAGRSVPDRELPARGPGGGVESSPRAFPPGSRQASASGQIRPLFRNCDCLCECQRPGKKYQDWKGARQPGGEPESALSRPDSGEAAERAKKTNQLRAFGIA
jgi:hypothetical protein